MADFSDPMQEKIFVDIMSRSTPISRWSVSDLSTGVTYKNGEACGRALGVSGGAVNNCIHNRQKTCKGHKLVRTFEFRLEMLCLLNDICLERGLNVYNAIDRICSGEKLIDICKSQKLQPIL